MKDAYTLLADKLGHGGSERFKKILRRLMDEDGAQIAASLPCPAPELAQKLNKREEDITTKLEELFGRGVVFMTSKGYQFARDLLQLHDATASDVRLDGIWGRELLDLWEDFCQAEWYPGWAKGIQTLNTPAWRVIPARKAVPEGASLLPAEDLESILDQSTRFAVVHCACRRVAARCDLPLEVCLQLNRGAEYVLARGTGRELTREGAMDVLDEAVAAGLIHSVYNLSQAINVICNCCTDCCVFYYPLSRYGGLEKGVARSRFRAEVDQTTCLGCQTCVERCPFGAVEMVRVTGEKKLKAQVDTEGCFGCGVCVVGCESDSIRLVEVRPPEQVSA